jgi:hypothetical protein
MVIEAGFWGAHGRGVALTESEGERERRGGFGLDVLAHDEEERRKEHRYAHRPK